MDEFKLVVASNLIRLRTAANMTQAELGEKINYSDKTVSKWERAESVPDTFALKQIADIFGVTADFILTSHDKWEDATVEEENEKATMSIHDIIIMITLAGEFLIAFLVFTIFWILGTVYWQIFVYALPAVLITWLTLNSLWHKGRGNCMIVSALVMSLFLVVYIALLQATQKNPWQIFTVAIPAEAVVILSFVAVKIKRL
ncbi:MAG: helix-turn-helix transcriptional regulator [Clostridia bacterium]|nr:helix-turn-helix transcriptional regulator [Clostridia bacterium]